MNLEELKTLCENATPGPWEAVEDREFYSCTVYPSTGDPIASEMLLLNGAHDARFIAAARTALPKLIAVVEAVREITKGDLPPEGFDSYAEGFGVGQDILAQKIDEAINNALEES